MNAFYRGWLIVSLSNQECCFLFKFCIVKYGSELVRKNILTTEKIILKGIICSFIGGHAKNSTRICLFVLYWCVHVQTRHICICGHRRLPLFHAYSFVHVHLHVCMYRYGHFMSHAQICWCVHERMFRCTSFRLLD